jgi:hypothetical protein
VVPAEIPRICVCTAPATPTVHKSLLLPLLNCGEIAEGGGDFTVVVISPSVLIVLLLVDSVTTVCAYARFMLTTIILKAKNILFIMIFLSV